MTISRVLAVAALTGVVLGFSNTSPVIVWSSTSSIALNALPARPQDGIHTLALLQSLVDTDSICDFDAVVVVEQPGLHAFDLRSLPTESGLLRRINSSPSVRQYPYVQTHPEFDALTVARMVSSNCQSQLSHSSLGNVLTSLEHHSEKHVLTIVMPDLSESGKMRKDSMAAHEFLLSQELDLLAGKFSNHLVILAGSPQPSSSTLFKRQAPIPAVTDHTNTSPIGSGILNRYQLLTPALITSLLVFFFIFLPIVFCGIKGLASIQNPIRMDTTKSSFNALEKKNQ